MTRNRRLLLLVVALAVAAGVVAVAVALSSRDSSSSSPPAQGANDASRASTSRKLLRGIPQHGITLGRPDAPATLVEFADPQCPYCGEWSRGAFPLVVRRFVRTGKLRLQFRGLEFLGADSDKALRAIYAAGLQNRAWNMAEELYARQGSENTGWVTDEVLREAATAAGVDYDRMTADASSSRVSNLIGDADRLAARLLGRVQTPSFVLVRAPATPQLVQAPSLAGADFAATLAAALGA